MEGLTMAARSFRSTSLRFGLSDRRASLVRRVPRRVEVAPVWAGGLEDFINSVTIAIQKSPLAQGKKALAKLQAGSYDVDKVNADLDRYITSQPVMMFSFSTCPFCVKAKRILDDVGARYTAIELNEMGAEGYALRAELAERTGRTSVPNIWIGAQSVGGCHDGPGIVTLQTKGELVPMLKAAGAL